MSECSQHVSGPNMNPPKMSECAQHECINVGTFFGWLFLCPNFQNAPRVNVLMLAHSWGGYFCAQGEYVNAGAFFGWLFLCPNFQSAPKVNVLVLAHFLLLIYVPKFSECTQGECANSGAFFGWLFLCPIFQSAPNMNVLMFVHSLGGYFCTHNFKVHPR